MNQTRAVCYVTDYNFLLPSIISAASLRQYITPEQAAVFIFLTDGDDAEIEIINKTLREDNIVIQNMSASLFEAIDMTKFKKSHVPLASVGRFFLADILPESYEHIIYLDGDTWVARDPSVLIDTSVPEGRYAATYDAVYFRQHNSFSQKAKDIRTYFKTLGIPAKTGYGNGGVFAVSRATWKELSDRAFNFLVNNLEICQYHDQSALNAVAGHKRLPLSTRWNFQTPFRYLNADDKVKPCIYHLNHSPKAWTGHVIPWKDLYEEYNAMRRKYAHLNLPISHASDEIIQNHNARVQKRDLLNRVPLLAKIIRQVNGFDRYEKQAWL